MIKRVYCPECRRLAEKMQGFMVEIVESLKTDPVAGKSDAAVMGSEKR
jgi:hypothetical protein